MGESGPDRTTLAAFVAMTLLGGVNAVAVRLTVAELPPFWGAGLRFVLAGLILVPVMVLARRSIPRGDHLRGTLIFGILNFGLSYVFIYWALQDVPAGTTMVLLAVVPLLTLLLAVAHGVERFRRAGLVGALVAAAGIAVIFGDQATLEVPLLSLLAILAGAVCMAESGVMAKRHPPGDPIAANAVGMLLGATLLIALSLVTREPLTLPTLTETWLAVGYLVLIGSVALFILVLYVLERWTASAVSYAFLLTPLVTVALGAVLLDETFRPTFLVGGLLVLAGVYIGAFYRPRPTAQEAPVPAATAAPPAGALAVEGVEGSPAEGASVPVVVQTPCP